jgi:hypothetical protein
MVGWVIEQLCVIGTKSLVVISGVPNAALG